MSNLYVNTIMIIIAAAAARNTTTVREVSMRAHELTYSYHHTSNALMNPRVHRDKLMKCLIYNLTFVYKL